MEVQNLQKNILQTLKNKSADSIAYKRALTIYESILQSTSNVPNFKTNYASSDSNFALFIFGSVYKILSKNESSTKYSLQSLFLLINQTLPHTNVNTLKTNGLLKQLEKKVFLLITKQSQEKTPLMLRLAVSIISFTLVNNDSIENDKQSSNLLCSMFDLAVGSHRTNTLSKQSSKMLSHLVKNNTKIAIILSRYANMNMLGNMQSNLYLNNVRQVISQFPRQQVNDIGYRVAKYISTVDINSLPEQNYLTQIYFFLEKLMTKFSANTLEEICKELINNVPSSAHSQSKVTFCYLQALHTSFESLVSMNEHTANKFLSSIVSITQEFISKGGRVEKHAYGILKQIMANCIRKSLWVGKQTNDELDLLNIQGIELETTNMHRFGKIICLLSSMLSDQYKNKKATSTILVAFFGSLDQSAFNETLQLIDRIVQYRENFEDRQFKSVMHAVFGAMSIQKICEIYPISVSGNIADENFEGQNNLWLVHSLQQYEGQQKFSTFMKYFYPLLQKLQPLIKSDQINGVRRQAYISLKAIFWRCLKIFCRKVNGTQAYDKIVNAIKNQLTVASDSVLDHIAQALQFLSSCLQKIGYQCVWAGNLISLFAKNLDIQKNNAKQIIRAIKYLSGISNREEYLNRVFDKNIIKLLQEKENGTLSKEENVQANMKNMEILMAVSNGIDFTSPAVVQPYNISRQQLVVKIIQLLIVQDNLFQKKAYKYIFETIVKMGSGFRMEVIDLLDAHQHKIMPSSKHYRMSILNIIWRQLGESQDNLNAKFSFIKTYLPEIMINMRQPNQRTRKQADYIFESFCSKLGDLGLLQNFIEIMCAGLATDSIDMKISTITALASIFTKKMDIQLQFSIGILEIVLMLLYQKNREIFKAVVDYCRWYILSIQKTEQSREVLKTMIEQLFKVDSDSRMQYRSLFKHFLLKLVKKFSRETVEKMIPSEDRKMLSNAIKTENRQKRKLRQKKIQRREYYEKMKRQKALNNLQSSEDQRQNHSEGGMDIEQDDDLQELQKEDNLLLKYDLDKQNFHFEEEKLNIRQTFKRARKQQLRDDDDITFGENGIMIVKDQKRMRPQNEDKPQQQEENPVGYANVKKRRKLNDVHTIKQSGDTYRSNRAGGDVKQKDKPQPYAFIQFNSKALNKRFKKRAQQAFETIFEKNEGGLKGIRSKIANRH